MSEVKKCPNCGREMKNGYVKLREGIRWRTEEKRRGELLRWGGVFWVNEYKAYLCRECQLLMLNY